MRQLLEVGGQRWESGGKRGRQRRKARLNAALDQHHPAPPCQAPVGTGGERGRGGGSLTGAVGLVWSWRLANEQLSAWR